MEFLSSVLFILAPCSEKDYLASQGSDMDIQWHYGIRLSSVWWWASSLKLTWRCLFSDMSWGQLWMCGLHLLLLSLYSVRRLIRFEMCLLLFCWLRQWLRLSMKTGRPDLKTHRFSPYNFFQCDKFDIVLSSPSLWKTCGMLIIFHTSDDSGFPSKMCMLLLILIL